MTTHPSNLTAAPHPYADARQPTGSADPVDALVARFPRILAIGHDLGGGPRSTGSGIPLAQMTIHVNARHPGAMSLLGISEAAHVRKAAAQIAEADLVILNSLGLFATTAAAPLLRLLQGKPVFLYLHETEYAAEAARVRRPRRMAQFWRTLPQIPLLLCTQRQGDWFTSIAPCRGTVVGNAIRTADLPPPFQGGRPVHRQLRVINVATIQDRKDPQLFDAVARLAEQRGLDMRFTWIGRRTGWISKNFRFSKAVEWMGEASHAEVLMRLSESDVFFLSSIDDPLPLSVTEAAWCGLRIVSHKVPGCHEVLAKRPGYESFSSRTPKAALDAIQRAADTLTERIDHAPVAARFTASAFADRVAEAVLAQAEVAIYPGLELADAALGRRIKKARRSLSKKSPQRQIEEIERFERFVSHGEASFLVPLAEWAFALGETERALHYVHTLAESRPGETEHLARYARRLQKDGRHFEAIDLLDRAACGLTSDLAEDTEPDAEDVALIVTRREISARALLAEAREAIAGLGPDTEPDARAEAVTFLDRVFAVSGCAPATAELRLDLARRLGRREEALIQARRAALTFPRWKRFAKAFLEELIATRRWVELWRNRSLFLRAGGAILLKRRSSDREGHPGGPVAVAAAR
jgi:glycosyltransferase involved in cell wall biosynthesis